jgi:lipopolysaccharide transport system permease protein
MTLRNLWYFLIQLKANRNLLRNLVLRDLKHRYVGSVGGFFWSVIHPIVLLVCYYFVLTVVMGVRLGEEYATQNFALFLFCGILPWLMFQETVLRNCTAVTDNASLITKTIIPSEILPMSIMISNLIHHMIGLVILIGALLLFHSVELSVLWVFAYMPILILLAQGLGWLVSSLNVFFRDTSQVLTVMMIFWFWFTPIFYPPELVPEGFRLIMALNPMATVVSGYRNAFLQMPPPGVENILILLGWTGVIFLVGALFFRRSKAAFADVL